jgi:hypothetical protein
MLEEF